VLTALSCHTNRATWYNCEVTRIQKNKIKKNKNKNTQIDI